MSYKLAQSNAIQRLSDGATLPARFENGQLVELDPHSPFVKELREWIAAGNIPLPADPEPVREVKPMLEERVAALEARVKI